MPLWETRRQALFSLESDLRSEKDILEDGFGLLDEYIEKFQNLNSPPGRICSLILIKARNLALGMYSLALDGLAQESGALFRPLIEALELLTYLRLDPSRTEQIIEERLPSAGKIAKAITGDFKDTREFLNKHSSHFSMTYDSVAHIVDLSKFRLKIVQPHSKRVLLSNLHLLESLLVIFLFEAHNCLDAVASVDDEVADRIEAYRDEVRSNADTDLLGTT